MTSKLLCSGAIALAMHLVVATPAYAIGSNGTTRVAARARSPRRLGTALLHRAGSAAANVVHTAEGAASLTAESARATVGVARQIVRIQHTGSLREHAVNRYDRLDAQRAAANAAAREGRPYTGPNPTDAQLSAAMRAVTAAALNYTNAVRGH